MLDFYFHLRYLGIMAKSQQTHEHIFYSLIVNRPDTENILEHV